MAGYRELVEGNEISESERGLEARRTFINDTAGTSDLPVLGDLYDSTNPNFAYLRCRERYQRHFGGHPENYIYTIVYRTPDLNNMPVDDTIHIGSKSFDNLPCAMEWGAEIITVDQDDDVTSSNYGKIEAWKWEGSSTLVSQPMQAFIISGSVLCLQKVSDISTYNTVALTKLGKLNSEAYWNFPVNSLMYIGHSAREEYDNAGNKKWSIDMQFAFKLTFNTDHTTLMGAWNYLLRKSTGEWVRPVRVSDGSTLYQSTTFTSLLI